MSECDNNNRVGWIWRVGKRNGQNRWQIKQAPGWRVAHQCDTLHEAAEWLTTQGVELAQVSVLSQHPWPTLGELVAKGRLDQ